MLNIRASLFAIPFALALAGCGTSTPPLTQADVIAGLKTACSFEVFAPTANAVIGALINAYVPTGGTLTQGILNQIEADVCAQVNAKVAEAKVGLAKDGEITVIVNGVEVTGKVVP